MLSSLPFRTLFVWKAAHNFFTQLPEGLAIVLGVPFLI